MSLYGAFSLICADLCRPHLIGPDHNIHCLGYYTLSIMLMVWGVWLAFPSPSSFWTIPWKALIRSFHGQILYECDMGTTLTMFRVIARYFVHYELSWIRIYHWIRDSFASCVLFPIFFHHRYWYCRKVSSPGICQAGIFQYKIIRYGIIPRHIVVGLLEWLLYYYGRLSLVSCRLHKRIWYDSQ